MALFRLFAAGLQHQLSIDDRTLDRARAARAKVDENVRRDPAAAALFWSLVDHPHGDAALLDMHACGILARYLPEFDRATNRVQADFYHVHTVDVHTLHVLQLLYALRRGEGDAHFAPLVQHEPSFRSLVLGCLFHDAGKGTGRDHSEVGAELVEAAMVRLAAPLADILDAQFLVKEHLAMPKISQRRDLSDAALIDTFAKRCETAARLQRLYVLSYVDTSATGPTLWTPWKAALLRELFQRTTAALLGEVATTSEEAETLAPTPERNECYLGGEAHGHRTLYVASRDRPGLIATVAAVCTECHMSIASADVRSRAGYAHDRFMIRDSRLADPDRQSESRQAHYDEFIARLRDVLDHGVDFSKITLPAFAPAYAVPKVSVQQGEQSALGRVVDVFAPDRPGLLFALARAIFFAGFSIEVARISTEGARAIDSFYLRGPNENWPALIDALREAATP